MLPRLLSANALYQRIQLPSELLLLDVRNSEEFARLRIETRHTPETLHIPYMEFIEEETLESAVGRIPVERPIVVVCAHGGSSEYVAGILRRQGYNVANLAGGMEQWARLHVIRPVVQDSSIEIYQIDRIARGCLSYVIMSDGWAAIIDPSYYIDEYRGLMAACGAMPRLIIDTHAHADHISGGRGLADTTGAPYYLHPYDAIHPFDLLPATVPYEILRDGHRFKIGSMTLQAIHTPGHTLGHVALLATSMEGDAYLFSGDTVFLGSIGRPDLGGRAESWAQLAYRTIFGTLRERVTSEALILPGHYANASEADERGLYTATLGNLWRTNQDLSFIDQESFVRHAIEHMSPPPPEYIDIKRINIGLAQSDPRQTLELEMGKNICALTAAHREPAEMVIA